MALDQTFEDGRVQTVNVGISSSIVSENIYGQFHVHVNTNLIFPKFQTRRNSNDGVADQRGRRKAAELDTSGAKRAEIWREKVKWCELAIGLTVVSGA